MESPQTPRVLSFFPAAIFLAVIGWGGLILLMNLTRPATWQTLWLFFFMAVMAVTGTVLPATAFLNRRFPTTPPATPSVVAREALWFGLYFAVLAWLQIGRVLNAMLAILLVVGFAIIEAMLRLREISQWKPEKPPADGP
jgi:hypothetical protein